MLEGPGGKKGGMRGGGPVRGPPSAPPPVPGGDYRAPSLDVDSQWRLEMNPPPIKEGSPIRLLVYVPLAVIIVAVPIAAGTYYAMHGFRQAIEERRSAEVEVAAWEAALKIGTMESLQAYVNKYPDGPHKTQAASETTRLRTAQEHRDDVAWAEAVRADAPDAYTHYLLNSPSGRYRDEAERRLRGHRESEDRAWEAVAKTNTREAYDAFLLHYPNGLHLADAVKNRKALIGSAARPLSAVEDRGLKAGDEFEECAECPTMIAVPNGEFLMGSTQSDVDSGNAGKEETPQHMVSIPGPFAIGKFEVTFEQWDDCVANGGCRGFRPGDEGWGRLNRPVINISWDDAKLYVKWLSLKTQKSYRLLSEAEWEFAARAGTTTQYYFGDDGKSLCQYANIADESGKAKDRGGPGLQSWVTCYDGYPNSAPVGVFRPNPFGLYDMLGNVAEWVEDGWHENYLGAPENGSVWEGGSSVNDRIVRGGSWYHLSGGVRAAYRMHVVASGGSLVGMRVARSIER